MSQVLRWLEVRNQKRRTVDTRQSSGTSAGTFAVSAGSYINYCPKAGTKNEGWKIDLYVSNRISRWFLFQGVQVHPWTDDLMIVQSILTSPNLFIILTLPKIETRYARFAQRNLGFPHGNVQDLRDSQLRQIPGSDSLPCHGEKVIFIFLIWSSMIFVESNWGMLNVFK